MPSRWLTTPVVVAGASVIPRAARVLDLVELAAPGDPHVGSAAESLKHVGRGRRLKSGPEHARQAVGTGQIRHPGTLARRGPDAEAASGPRPQGWSRLGMPPRA